MLLDDGRARKKAARVEQRPIVYFGLDLAELREIYQSGLFEGILSLLGGDQGGRDLVKVLDGDQMDPNYQDWLLEGVCEFFLILGYEVLLEFVYGLLVHSRVSIHLDFDVMGLVLVSCLGQDLILDTLLLSQGFALCLLLQLFDGALELLH